LTDSASPSKATGETIRRVAYLGTPGVAVPPLQAMVDAGFDVPLVISGPDKRRGRGSTLHPSPVKAAALDLGLTVSDRVDDLLDVDLDLAVVVAYGHLIKPNVLGHVPMVNLHFSLLPRWRGAAPVERALLEGDEATGVCVMALEEGLDTGGVYRRVERPITSMDTLESLRNDLVAIGSDLLVNALSEGLGVPEPQVGEPTYAKKIQPEELHLDLSEPAILVDRVVRLGRAWTTHDGARLRIWDVTVAPARSDLSPGEIAVDKTSVVVGCGQGALELATVQPEGRARMGARDWANGNRIESGVLLGR
jgi:methionyl-tRNA formyltransferase